MDACVWLCPWPGPKAGPGRWREVGLGGTRCLGEPLGSRPYAPACKTGGLGGLTPCKEGGGSPRLVSARLPERDAFGLGPPPGIQRVRHTAGVIALLASGVFPPTPCATQRRRHIVRMGCRPSAPGRGRGRGRGWGGGGAGGQPDVGSRPETPVSVSMGPWAHSLSPRRLSNGALPTRRSPVSRPPGKLRLMPVRTDGKREPVS